MGLVERPFDSVGNLSNDHVGHQVVAFEALRDVPPEAEWFANIDNLQTRRAYQNDIRQFMQRWGMVDARQFRDIGRAHILQWRAELEAKKLAGATIRRKLAALSSLYKYLCDAHTVPNNPVSNIKRPKVDSRQGKTPALGDHQARQLLAAPDDSTLKGLRDKAILSVLLYHGLRRAELTALSVADLEMRRGVMHLRVHGKGDKLRFLPLHPNSAELINRYLEQAGHQQQDEVCVFQALHPGNQGKLAGMTPNAVYTMVLEYANQVGIQLRGFGPHSLRATAATNALENGAGLEKVQDWLGHADPATTRMYDHREQRAEDSPTFKVSY